MTDRFEVGPDGEGRRLDAWLAAAAGMSRSEAQRLLDAGLVAVDGSAAPKSLRLRAGQSVDVRRPPPRGRGPEPAPFAVVHEDEHLAVISKPAGVVVHPGAGTGPGRPARGRETLVETLARRMSLAPAAGPDRPGIVHRLDRDTSGLLVVAKTDEAYRALIESMRARTVSRTYLALAWGSFRMPTGRIEAPVGRSPRAPGRMQVAPGGRESVTEFRVLEALGPASLVEVGLLTGRTHQIRVHLAHIGHPVVGDAVYGKRTASLAQDLGLSRPFLHAARLRFAHPVTGAELDLAQPLPAELERALSKARERHGGPAPGMVRR